MAGKQSNRTIPISGPWITDNEIRLVTEAVTNAWFDKSNVYNVRFETAFAQYLGRQAAVSLPSCTSAIHLSLAALGIEPGDEVVVPDVTWIASAAPITYVGATPVFADIDETTWCLSAESLQQCITNQTRAIIAVDLYGNMPDYDTLLGVADAHGIPLIEDAAEAIGSEWKSRKAGAFGTTAVFSFHGSKTITTGEGGMLVTDDNELRRRILFLRDHGRPPGDRMFYNTEVAFKYKMTSMQAALGLAQLERIDEIVARKRQVFQWYEERLAGFDGIQLNETLPAGLNSYWMVTIVLQEPGLVEKAQLTANMAEHGIDARPFFHPLSSLPAYRDSADAKRARERNKVSYRISPYGINLPSGATLSEDDVDYVAKALLKCLGRK